jgi:hypothetical protein
VWQQLLVDGDRVFGVRLPAHRGNLVPQAQIDRTAAERFPRLRSLLLAKVNHDQRASNGRLPARKALCARRLLRANKLPQMLQRFGG